MLSLIEIDKAYGATRAVKAVSLQAAPGSVLGLVGENGAGKSTLIKTVSGAVVPDSGRITLDGKELVLRHTNDALAHGIASVFQELTLIRELTVEWNLLLTSAPVTPWRSIDRKAMRRRSQEILARYRLDIDPAARVGDLPLGQQQMIEIVRAVERRPRVLLLDEATSALGATEVAWLSELVADLRRQQTIILFISHRWDEIMHFSDRVAIMRNGVLAAETAVDALTEREAVRLMTGQDAADTAFPSKDIGEHSVALSARNLCSNAIQDVSFDLHRGEILGLGGLVGQGQSNLLEALFGVHALTRGTIALAGGDNVQLTPQRAIATGIAYIPQERKTEGLLLSKSVAVNMTLATLARLKSFCGIVDPGAEHQQAMTAIRQADIRTQGPAEPIGNLSGGNQQKVLLEKWLRTNPAILLLNDVTRGVDVRTKHHIYELVATIARRGVGIIWYSTDARELAGIAHRVIVMLRGRINAELTREDIAVDRIIHASIMDIGAGESDVRAAS